MEVFDVRRLGEEASHQAFELIAVEGGEAQVGVVGGVAFGRWSSRRVNRRHSGAARRWFTTFEERFHR